MLRLRTSGAHLVWIALCSRNVWQTNALEEFKTKMRRCDSTTYHMLAIL